MNEREIAKIRGFINEKEMSESVYNLLFRNFLQKRNGSDVHILAAQTLAVQFLEEAWMEMERYKTEKKKDNQPTVNYV
jgi:hypothetical protein